MKATLLPGCFRINSFYGDKPKAQTLLVVALDPKTKEAVVPVKAEFFKTQARSYCQLKAGIGSAYRGSSAWVGGYGYHRPSAALRKALDACGIQISENIDGGGSYAMKSALLAVADALGYKDLIIFIEA